MPLSEPKENRRVWKFAKAIDLVTDVMIIEMPRSAKILTVANQQEQLAIWADCVTTAPKVERKFRVAATGNQIGSMSPGARYVGTALFMGGSLVLHVFDLGET